MGNVAAAARDLELMARIATAKVVIRTEGLYQLIVRSVEDHFADWDSEEKPRHHLSGELLPHPYPYQRVLDAARAGMPVNVALVDLPVDVVRSAPTRPGGRTRMGREQLPPTHPARAVVAPDDSVTFPDDSASLALWMEEDGWYNDHGPRPRRLELPGQMDVAHYRDF